MTDIKDITEINIPLISICIPTYKRADGVKRLLESISVQTFIDFEVIITDDSPTDDLKQLCDEYAPAFSIKYIKNASPLGTPENWNEAIRHAAGKWIKIIHDDDWLATADALQKFADAANEQACDFIFSAYTNIYENGKQRIVFPEKYRLNLVQKEPSILLARNFIGPPSVVMHKNDQGFWYDQALKWLVDIDMYMRRLKEQKYYYIPEPLINVGVGKTQVTNYVKTVPEIQIPEHFHLLEKMGVDSLKNVLVYDYWWRFLRNFKIKSSKQFYKYGYKGNVPGIIRSMIRLQKFVPARMLRKGVISKSLMATHFLLHKKKISS